MKARQHSCSRRALDRPHLLRTVAVPDGLERDGQGYRQIVEVSRTRNYYRDVAKCIRFSVETQLPGAIL